MDYLLAVKTATVGVRQWRLAIFGSKVLRKLCKPNFQIDAIITSSYPQLYGVLPIARGE